MCIRDRWDAVQLATNWTGRRVIGMSDSLWGLLDGMNDDGLAVSLAFGGRKVVGVGFGMPLILRYVLETCCTVDEGVAALLRIPSHMSYNVTLVDAQGAYQTVYVAVSYTHLTLPTSDLVQISVAAASLKKKTNTNNNVRRPRPIERL